MGYTGKKAMQIKISYIEAFNAMEAQITSQTLPALPPLQRTYTLPTAPYEKATPAQRRAIDHARKAWVAAAVSNGRMVQHADSWQIIRGHFGNLSRISDLPAAWVDDAVTFCQELLGHEIMQKTHQDRELVESEERRGQKALPEATQQLPVPVPVAQSSWKLPLSGDEVARLNALARRVEELNSHVIKEINDLHEGILECLNLQFMPTSVWLAMSTQIYNGLQHAVVHCGLSGEHNPAIFVKMLAGAEKPRRAAL